MVVVGGSVYERVFVFVLVYGNGGVFVEEFKEGLWVVGGEEVGVRGYGGCQ